MDKSTKSFEINKGWQWLFYIYLVLPLLLFGMAYLLRDASLGVSLARIFHSYNLYVVNPFPDMSSLSGIIGLIIPLYFLYKTVRRRDYVDLGLCLLLIALNALYFLMEWNYLFIHYLHFA